MAVEDTLSGIGAGIGKAMGGLGTAFPYIVGVIVAGLLGWWAWYEMQFNKKVILYKITGNSYRMISEKARFLKDKNNITFWHLRNTGLKVDVPPSQCMMMSKKGEVAEGYLNNQGEVIWIQHAYNPEQLLKKVMKEGEDKLDAHEKHVLNFIKSFRPVSTTQRVSYSYQVDKAKAYLKTDFLRQNMPIILGGVFLVLMLIVFMMMFGKVMQPIMDASDKVTEYQKVNLEIVEVMRDMQGDIQVLKDQANVNEAIPNE
jgi:hypothetical protein